MGKHDQLFKFIFSDPVNAASVFRAFLPPEILAQTDLTTLRVEPGSFVDKALASRHSDLLYSVAIGDLSASLHLLFEHQSTPDPLMPLRCAEYAPRIWRRAIQEAPGAIRLRPLIPIVLYHGRRRWTAPRSLFEMYTGGAQTLDALRPFLPQVSFILHDLSAMEDEALREHAELTAAAAIALGSLKNGRSPAALFAWLKRSVRLIHAIEHANGGLRALEAVFRYAFSADVPLEPLKTWADRTLGQGAKEVLMTTADRLIEQGREEGLEQGLEQGRLEARLAEGRKTLQRLLRFRFGEIDAEIIGRIDLLPLPDLDALLERLFEPGFAVDAVSELFPEPAPGPDEA